jgi:hypothetical protein
MRERASNHSELTKLIITASSDKVNMLGETEFTVKGDTQVTDRGRESNIRKQLS